VVGFGQHQCLGGRGGSLITIDVLGLLPITHIWNIGSHGYVVAGTEPGYNGDPSVKYFKLNIKSYSKSNVLQNSVVKNLKCTKPGMQDDVLYLACHVV